MGKLDKNMIGKLHHLRSAQHILFTLPCIIQQAAKIQCSILDERGELYWQQSFFVQTGQDSIRFQVPLSFSAKYQCVIVTNGQRSSQTIIVKTPKTRSLFKGLKSLF